MNVFSNIFRMANKGKELIECCKTLYWDEREERKNETIEMIKLQSKDWEEALLSTAIRLCSSIEDERKVLLILWSVLDSDKK